MTAALLAPDAKKLFQSILEEHFENTRKEEHAKIRDKAWDHFLKLGLPSKEMEAYRYITLRKLYQQPFHTPPEPKTLTANELTPYLLPECEGAVLVFVNGFFQPKLSQTEKLSDRVVINTFQAAQRTYGTFINNHWTKSLQEEADPLVAANAALNRDGAFLYLPPKSVVTTPIQLLFVIDGETAMHHLVPRLTVLCGAHSEVTLVSTQAVLSGTNSYLLNQCTDIMVEEGAHVNVYQINDGNPLAAWHFDALRATLKRDSVCKVFAITNGCATMRSDYRMILMGENADVQLNGLWMLQGKREAHVHVLIDHQAPHCRSMQIYKGVLNDCSRSSFEGKILVRKLAQKTDAYQRNHNLLLSDQANAYSKPNLEIFADDVKASHGATVGPLDDDQLFYLKTRGYFPADAEKILVTGFCREIIEGIPHGPLKHLIAQKMKRLSLRASD